MLTLEDCLGICELSEDEIRAIALHEHIPEIVAAEMGQYLVHAPDGTRRIKRIILDDIEEQDRRGHTEQADNLRLVLAHFIASHPDFPAKAVGT